MKSMLRDKRMMPAAMVSIGLVCSSAAGLKGEQARSEHTKANARDTLGQAPTADQQRNDRSDLEIARQIRHAIVADKSLSTSAHNVKVIAQHGRVTLRGPVRTEEEKKTVEAKAADVAGATNVSSKLSVTTGRSTTRRKHNPA